MIFLPKARALEIVVKNFVLTIRLLQGEIFFTGDLAIPSLARTEYVCDGFLLYLS